MLAGHLCSAVATNSPINSSSRRILEPAKRVNASCQLKPSWVFISLDGNIVVCNWIISSQILDFGLSPAQFILTGA